MSQPNRAIRPVQRLAFYTAREIKPEIPEILGVHQGTTLSTQVVQTLTGSTDPVDRRVAEIIRAQLDDTVPHTPGPHDIYVLSPPDDPRTTHLAQPLPYLGPGAFTQGQRYVDLRLQRGGQHPPLPRQILYAVHHGSKSCSTASLSRPQPATRA